MSKRIIALLLALLFLAPAITLTTQLVRASGGVGIHDDFPHARVAVTEVIDGDTIRISPPVYVANEYRTVVRFADIDAPELDPPGGAEARETLENLLAQHGGVVYLDIDKTYGVDDYGRVIAVVYVRTNDTTLLNVNKWMVENGYAVIDDRDNDFDPSKWSLHITYEKEKEKLPTITRVVLYSGFINYGTSWGVKVATTPDKNYLGIAFSEGSAGNYSLNVVILDASGNVVRTYRYGPDKYNSDPTQSRYAYVFRGMLDIAANESGFLVVWSNHSRRVGTTTRSYTTLYSYVPINPDLEPTTPTHIYHASYQYHPTATYYVHQDGSKWWIVGYSSQSSTAGRYTINLLNSVPSYTGRYVLVGIYSGSPGPRIGVDVLGGLMFDEVMGRFYIIARGYNLGGTTAHDMAGIYGIVNATYHLVIPSPHCVDCRPGDQGPSTTTYGDGYSYYNAYPMYTKLLTSGQYLLTVYNETETSLAYGVIDLAQTTPGVTGDTLVSVSTPTTFYPWVASNVTHWLVAWNALGWANLSVVGTNGSKSGILTLADRSATFVKIAYDPGSRKFIIPYGVYEVNVTKRNLFVAFYNSVGDVLEPWVLPVGMDVGIDNTPLHVQVLGGGRDTPGNIVIIALDGDELVAYVVSSDYPELQNPIPIPEPVWVVIPILLITAFFVLRSVRPRRA